jgi:hypothetical protein
MLKRLLAFLRSAILWVNSAGTAPDNAALFGLIGLAANVNNYAESLSTGVTTATGTNNITVAQLLAGITMLNAGAGGAFTVNLPTTAQILAGLGPTIQPGNYAEPVSFQNNAVGQIGTVTAGDASTTVTGTATVATNTRRLFLMSVNANSTITLQNIGSVGL